MNPQSLHGPLKAVALLVLLLVLLSLLYAAYIAISHWNGIGV
ncbi:MAG: hypothetical protein ACM3VZ_02675 [Acidobacteriota bacterium]